MHLDSGSEQAATICAFPEAASSRTASARYRHHNDHLTLQSATARQDAWNLDWTEAHIADNRLDPGFAQFCIDALRSLPPQLPAILRTDNPHALEHQVVQSFMDGHTLLETHNIIVEGALPENRRRAQQALGVGLQSTVGVPPHKTTSRDTKSTGFGRFFGLFAIYT
jgi:hypothetical protein